MATYIILNGKVVENPLARFSIFITAVTLAACFMAVIVFVFLPLAGVAIALSSGLILVFMAALSVGILVLLVGTTIIGWLLEVFNPLRRK